ncbi:MAG: fumarylacetoacetate hydrolase family protein [SAR324 cluster bacterium]|nr:fumarylacetoacetate hydrolase family protein [SAR324 cluster bacterium]
MKIIAFEDNGAPALGVAQGETVAHLGQCAPELPSTLLGLIESGEQAFQAAEAAARQAGAEARRPLDGLRFLPPLPNPSKIICLGLNYADHAAEGGHAKPDYPSFFFRGPSSLVAHGAPLIRPLCSETLDYEAELVAVVGRRCRHVSESDALAVIAGYSVFNEATIREYQRRTSQWTIGKNFDGTGGFGPHFITADDLPPGAKGLRIQSRLNGKVMQDDNTSNMLFGVAETVALLTECLTLEPGDLLVMGTPAGVGHARRPPVWMKDGDVCEIDIEQVGVLRNPIENEPGA